MFLRDVAEGIMTRVIVPILCGSILILSHDVRLIGANQQPDRVPQSPNRKDTARASGNFWPRDGASLWSTIGPHHVHASSGPPLTAGQLQPEAVYDADTNGMYTGSGVGSGNEGPWTEAGVLKTTDGGVHWIPANRGMADHVVNALWVNQTDQNVVLAGT